MGMTMNNSPGYFLNNQSFIDLALLLRNECISNKLESLQTSIVCENDEFKLNTKGVYDHNTYEILVSIFENNIYLNVFGYAYQETLNPVTMDITNECYMDFSADILSAHFYRDELYEV